MSIRDVVVTIIIFGSLPVCFLRPWIGILVWSWISYMNPHRLTWSFAYTMPFGQMAAIATLAGLVFSGKTKPLPRTRTVALLLVFWMWITLTTLFANYPKIAWPEWEEVSKIFLMTFVTMLLFQEIKKIRYLMLTIVLSIAFFGVKSGLGGLLSGFSSMVYAYPPETFIADNNDLALALNMVLPLLLLLSQGKRRPLFKAAFYAIFGLTVLGVVSTFSRGGFLGLVVTIVMLVLRSRRKALGLAIIVVGGLLVAVLLSPSWYNRIGTIAEYQRDRSAQSRLEAWTVATRLALDSPVVGGGFRTLQPEIYRRYSYNTVSQERAAHSIFFQILSDHGFVGLGIFVALIASTWISLGRVAQVTVITPALSELKGLAQAIQISLIAFMVSGAFLSRAYFDLFYHLIGIAAVLAELGRWRSSAVSETTDEAFVVPGRPLPEMPGLVNKAPLRQQTRFAHKKS